MKTSFQFNDVTKAFSDVLVAHRCKFVETRTDDFVEYQVLEPHNIIIRISHLKETFYPRFALGMMFASRQDECTDVEIVARDKTVETTKYVSILLKDFVRLFPKMPWEGLSFLELITSKALWKKLLE